MPKKPPKRKSSEGTVEDGLALWRAVTETVTPIARRQTAASMPKPEPKTPETPRKPKAIRYTHGQSAPPSLTKTASTPKPAPRPEAGIDKRTEGRLRKGRLPIEGRLDLHGYDRESAHSALRGFIAASHSAGKRCVLIVTGKGKGILQSETPRWLAEPGLASKIVSVRTAQPKDGGSGALYVLLKRQRFNRGEEG